MLVLVVFCTVALLLLMTFGQLFPAKVFLGPAATRQKVTKYYGIPAAVGFLGLMVFGPTEKPAAPTEAAAVAFAPIAQPADAATPVKPTRTQAVEDNDQFLPVTFEGINLPGRIDDAKAAGFNDCVADYYGYKCTRAAPGQLFGVTAKSATLVMDGRDYFVAKYLVPIAPSGDIRQLPPERLAYGEVSMTFATPDFDSNCVDKHTAKQVGYDRPILCVKNKNTIAHLTEALADAGWVVTSSKGGYYNYVHPDEAVQIGVHKNVANVHRILLESVRDMVTRDAERRSASASAEPNAAGVLAQKKK